MRLPKKDKQTSVQNAYTPEKGFTPEKRFTGVRVTLLLQENLSN
jgi:hypothetical protein